MSTSRSVTVTSERLRALVRTNVPVFLSGYLRRLAHASAAAAALGASACASPFPTEQDLESPLCVDSRWQAAHGLAPAVTHGSLAVWEGGGFERSPYMMDEAGTRCAMATDVEACEAEVEATRELHMRSLVATDGDVVTRYTTEDDLRALLGPIDTAQEALLVAWKAGYDVQCGDLSRYGVREVEGGYEVVGTRMTMSCSPIEVRRYHLFVRREGDIDVLHEEVIERVEGACVGRRPGGLTPSAPVEADHALGRYFAEVARLESSAVEAFVVLARELEAHGAPRSLVEGALAAADDEVRHAAQMSALAHRFGAAPREASVEPRPLRALFDVALENAVEGCVRETFGALVGLHQAMAATDPEIARTMREVAEDESRHATLSWEIAGWVEPLLSHDDRERVARARAEAVLALRAELGVPVDPTLVEEAGMPAHHAAVALVDQLAGSIWS